MNGNHSVAQERKKSLQFLYRKNAPAQIFSVHFFVRNGGKSYRSLNTSDVL